MDFSEALNVIKSGKKCRRGVWPPGVYVHQDFTVTLAVVFGNNHEPGWAATSADMLAVDWQVVKGTVEREAVRQIVADVITAGQDAGRAIVGLEREAALAAAKRESDAAVLRLLGTDASKWAPAFMDALMATPEPDDTNGETLAKWMRDQDALAVAWFANAIEIGRDAGHRKAVAGIGRLRAALRGLGVVGNSDDLDLLAAAVEGLAAVRPPAFDFAAFADDKTRWSIETFGPGARTRGVIDHIRKELAEVEAEPDDVSEWVDLIILAMDGAARSAGADGHELVRALEAKMARNKARTWPDWRTRSEDEAIEHDRGGEAKLAKRDRADAVVISTEYVKPDARR